MAKIIPDERTKPGTPPAEGVWPRPATIMVIYDEMTAGLGAQSTLNRIAGAVGEHALDIRFWHYEFVARPDLWQQATDDVAEADLVVFAMVGSAALPVRCMSWVNRWRGILERGNTSFALLAGADCRKSSLVRLTRRFLNDFARRRTADFFSGNLPAADRL